MIKRSKCQANEFNNGWMRKLRKDCWFSHNNNLINSIEVIININYFCSKFFLILISNDFIYNLKCFCFIYFIQRKIWHWNLKIFELCLRLIHLYDILMIKYQKKIQNWLIAPKINKNEFDWSICWNLVLNHKVLKCAKLSNFHRDLIHL